MSCSPKNHYALIFDNTLEKLTRADVIKPSNPIYNDIKYIINNKTSYYNDSFVSINDYASNGFYKNSFYISKDSIGYVIKGDEKFYNISSYVYNIDYVAKCRYKLIGLEYFLIYEMIFY